MKAVEIECGFRHSMVLTSTGEIYAFGDNSCGQIELNSLKFVYTKPYKLEKLNHLIG
jgi:alpha-tubulin suppressor-like RCC1 family protein